MQLIKAVSKSLSGCFLFHSLHRPHTQREREKGPERESLDGESKLAFCRRQGITLGNALGWKRELRLRDERERSRIQSAAVRPKRGGGERGIFN